MVKKKESGELPNLAALKVAAARPFIVTNHKDRSEREYNTERKYKSKRGEKNKWRNDIETRRVNYVRTKFHLSIIYSVGWRSCISRELMERFRLVWQDRNSGRPAAFLFNRNRHPPYRPRCCIWQRQAAQTTFEITREFLLLPFPPFLAFSLCSQFSPAAG